MAFGHQLSIGGLAYNLGINYGINALYSWIAATCSRTFSQRALLL